MFTVSCLTRLHITQIAKWLHAGLGENVLRMGQTTCTDVGEEHQVLTY